MSQPTIQLPSDRYEALKVIGKGAYAQVLLANDRLTGQQVAIKAIHRAPPQMPLDMELTIMQEVHQPSVKSHVIQPIDSFTDGHRCYLVMDYLSGGDLYSRVEPNGPGLSKSQARTWIYQLTMAVKNVHSTGYVHADIKPENCMLDKDNNLYLADFGLAVRDGHVHAGSVPGTEAYMAPEMLGRIRQGGVKMHKPVDVFALGITWYAMLFADLPWDAASARDKDWQAFKQSGRLPGPSRSIGLLSHKLHHLMLRMLAAQPNKRATVDEVLSFLASKEPWFIVRRSTTKPTTTAPVAPANQSPGLKNVIHPVISPTDTKARRSSLVPIV